MTMDVHPLAEDKKTTCWELVPSSMIVPKLPDFVFGGFPRRLSDLWYRHLGLHRSGVFCAPDITVSRAFLLTREYIFSCPEANMHPAHIADELALLHTRKLRLRTVGGTCALICGPGYGIFGHWLVDFLPKLYLLAKFPGEHSSIKYLMPSDIQGFVKEILSMVGIPDRQIAYYDVDCEAIRTETLLIPTTPHNGLRASPVLKGFAEWMSAKAAPLTQHLKMPDARKVFIARGRAYRNRPLENRAQIEKLAMDRGIPLIYPEDFSLPELWRLFSNANVVIGEYGSALHASLFSRAGTVMCCLRGTLDHPGFVQSGIGAALSQPTGYVFGENAPGTEGGFSIGADDFRACLDLLDKEF